MKQSGEKFSPRDLFYYGNELYYNGFYQEAMECMPEADNMGIDTKEYYTWIPAIQLCVCYSRVGEY